MTKKKEKIPFKPIKENAKIYQKSRPKKPITSLENNMRYTGLVGGMYISLFMLLIGYLVYFTAFKQKQIATHPYNTRLNVMEEEVVRGNIYDANGELLAINKEGIRYYPQGNLYAHAVGYAQMGKTGMEAVANTQLLYPDYSFTSLFKNAFQNEKFEGRNVVLTLDQRYQEAAAEALGDYKGGVVVLEPSTGKVKAMYSSPTFNPNNLKENWEELRQDTERSPLVNRATSGLYPPGSIFKTLTALAFLEEKGENAYDFTYTCEGEIKGEDYTIQCYNKTKHGKVDLKQAFAVSCNTYFVKLTQEMPIENLKAMAEKCGFNEVLAFDMDHAMSRYQLLASDTAFEKAATYIGQGKTLVSPLHMAMLAGAIANDGILMKPYLLDRATNQKGTDKMKVLPQYVSAILDEKLAKQMQELMRQVVKEGTGSKLARKNIQVAGKTGTAQNETGKDHSWFMGFATALDNSKEPIAFAIIVENGGKGAKALDVTNRLLQVYEKIEE
ncbi:peptidoglycan glycosyltransferase [Sporanaerobium hydrogeniformans]|uniref:Peptidoglycan glycosyltransferase n=1 Tax=Sporanaerobium hydrogeniformans TaxID=3072179 RepID=A0AC61DCX9_9FIRM|nr:penicillin-binding transpeptidase domain-containing protein [Sporanaerobium hydrogeniformans]PHV71056.1 peptidoglycan glycosyltransferase [Sporanaerobium hydrogeniformans]